ncbi:sigma-54-dependent Fis family transcriptional regulator [Robertmurraya massiliosenegalensis]|uniref:sigma-54-dependent Fis family transcriptional regulator n=1 Tax=Robertmurraya massiliosenegalensis TaxID=1287657 RepID=UPI0002D6D897|nr:sigma-54-dependent Fis family transcriptional regulator [Robertmurraya massiliosenegalensis]
MDLKIKVLVIAPYQGLMESIKAMESKFTEFEIIIHMADLTESLMLLETYKDEALDFIISRGGTADLLREHTSIPVIDIEVSGYDILRILTLLKGYQQSMEMIAFKNIIQGFESISKLIDIDITYTVITHKDEVELAIQKAKQNEVKIVVGDTITVRLANELGMQGVLITSGRESIIEAFEKAKHMYQALERVSEETVFYQNILYEIDTPIALVEENGTMRFANHSFYKVLQVEQVVKDSELSLFEIQPGFKKIMDFIKKGLKLQYQLSIQENNELYVIKVDYLQRTNQKLLYVFSLQRTEVFKDEVNIVFYHKMDHFPQLLLSSTLFHTAVDIGVSRIQSRQPIAVSGEEGTGKSMFIQALFKSHFPKSTTLLEVKLGKVTMKSFNQLMKMLETEEEALIYIKGIENTSMTQQEKIIQLYKNIKAHLVFSFIGRNDVLADYENSLTPELFQILDENLLFFPPLREREDELEEMIKTFIVHYNERYGKQIVGVRPKVIDAMKHHPWNENLTELKKVIEEFVKATTDEYISEEVLPLLEENQVSEGQIINLNQPLSEIEADIINIVMRQENMNQSKVAKRLGINRSTLWRKLNNK